MKKMCEEYYDMFVFLDDLSPGEQQEVLQHLKECSTCREHFSAFQQIKKSLKQKEFAGHLDEDLLTRYGIYLSDPDEPDYDGRRLGRDEVANIKKHVERCQPCQQKVNRIVQEYREIEAHLEEEGLPSLYLGKASLWTGIKEEIFDLSESITDLVKRIISLPRLQLYPVAATVLAGIVILLWVSPLFRGSEYGYYHLAALELKNENFSYLTRGKVPALLSEGLQAFDRGEYQKSIEKIQQFITTNPNAPSLFYAHYVAGVATLSQAQSDFLGRFYKIDASLVDSAIQHLQAAIGLTNNLRVKEDAYWFMGKAYLLQQNEQKAEEAFKQVKKIKGRRIKAAQEIIATLETLQAEQ